ncbi:MAG: exodeoxyribonuclease VII small subunit [Candidatus Omnitrophica bacterium]|nr:exodeoxyribonuclease VII small subunit [Candidatus Omnitrophota bacterium]
MPEFKYSKAMKRIEAIIEKIENEEIDVDDLSNYVNEAATLIKSCKDKITKVESEVQKVVDDLVEPGDNSK